jgi:hypothetical protein
MQAKWFASRLEFNTKLNARASLSIQVSFISGLPPTPDKRGYRKLTHHPAPLSFAQPKRIL